MSFQTINVSRHILVRKIRLQVLRSVLTVNDLYIQVLKATVWGFLETASLLSSMKLGSLCFLYHLVRFIHHFSSSDSDCWLLLPYTKQTWLKTVWIFNSKELFSYVYRYTFFPVLKATVYALQKATWNSITRSVDVFNTFKHFRKKSSMLTNQILIF